MHLETECFPDIERNVQLIVTYVLSDLNVIFVLSSTATAWTSHCHRKLGMWGLWRGSSSEIPAAVDGSQLCRLSMYVILYLPESQDGKGLCLY